MPVKVAIVGATGYAGGELARLLLRHPEARLVATVARGRQGEPLRDVQPHLHSAPPSLTVSADPGDAEVVFTALPAGEAAKLAPAWLAEGRSLIDIGSDFRLRDPKDYERWYSYTHPAPELLKEAVYGLTELTRDRLRKARVVANPGCYPTAILLALAPLTSSGLIEEGSTIAVSAASGVTGAGYTPKPDLLFAEISEDFRAYGVGNTHRHLAEMNAVLRGQGTANDLIFTPHLLPVARGILATIVVRLSQELAQPLDLWRVTYKGEPFIEISDSTPALRDVVRRNVVKISVSRAANTRVPTLIITAAIDNLTKGAAGQAIQNANLMLGIAESTGLPA